MAVHVTVMCEVCDTFRDYYYHVSRDELVAFGWVFQDLAPEVQCTACHEDAQNEPRRDALRTQIAELQAELESLSR